MAETVRRSGVTLGEDPEAVEWNKYADFLNQVFPNLDSLEGEQYESAVDQLRVMVEVLAIMIERNKKYRDLWRKAGWLSHVHHIRHKAARLMNTFWGQKDVPKDADLDDAFDLINYTIYFIRSYRDGNERGTLW